MLNLKYPERWFRHLVSMPIIYSVIIPIVIMDLWIEVYHRLCFPLYGLPYVPRRAYIKIDRHKLRYLTWGQKLGCAYCGYANGAVAYFREIAAETEKYWCGIKHKKDRDFFREPEHHKNFAEYDSADDFKQKYHADK